MLDVEELPSMLTAYQNRWRERDERMRIISEAVAGNWSVSDDFGDNVENRSPNMVQVALEDTAEAASLIPSVRVKPSGPSDDDRRRSYAMEQIGIGYLDQSQIELLTIMEMTNLAAYGMCSLVSVINPETGSPYLQWRDPRTCYPEPDFNPMSAVQRCLFVRDVYHTQLPLEWQRKIEARVNETKRQTPQYWHDHKTTLLEYYDNDEIVIAALYKTNSGIPGGGHRSYMPIELHREETCGGVCPVIIGQNIKLDGEPRGQFDQVVRVMHAHIRLMGTILDYADQAVYSDVWVKDLIGEMPIGGGSYIQLGPQGAIGRVAPAVPSLSVFNELQSLMDSIHVGGRWPKARPGQIDQAIASGKFLETSAGMMNTAIRTLHLISKRLLEQAMRVMFLQDFDLGRDRTVSGILRNQQFQMQREKADIDLEARITVEYGLGLGREPAQSMVLGIQANQAGLVSTEFVQENFEGITDVALERRRLDLEKFRDMALARLMQGLESGEITESALIEIAKARQNGEDVFDLYDKFIVKPKEEAEAQMMTSGLDGTSMMPGMPPGGGGAMPPMPPGLEQILGGGGPPGAPPGGPPSGPPGGPPGGPQLGTIARTSMPMGQGSFAGVETRG